MKKFYFIALFAIVALQACHEDVATPKPPKFESFNVFDSVGCSAERFKSEVVGQSWQLDHFYHVGKDSMLTEICVTPTRDGIAYYFTEDSVYCYWTQWPTGEKRYMALAYTFDEEFSVASWQVGKYTEKMYFCKDWPKDDLRAVYSHTMIKYLYYTLQKMDSSEYEGFHQEHTRMEPEF